MPKLKIKKSGAKGRKVFLATLKDERCLFAADGEAKVLAVVPKDTPPSQVAQKKGLQIVPRESAKPENRLAYVRAWNAEHSAN